jgi:hypothetical protein
LPLPKLNDFKDRAGGSRHMRGVKDVRRDWAKDVSSTRCKTYVESIEPSDLRVLSVAT